ncbi:MAG: hypothetical protein ACOYO1_06080 [Bacteroidales bacterium]
MKKIIFGLVFLAVTACRTDYYWPSVQNVPLFDEKQELQLLVGAGKENTFFQSAYSLTNHIGFQFTYKTTMENYGISYDDKISSNYLVEGGIGYYFKYQYLAFETFAGYGYSYIQRDDYFRKSIVDFNRKYLQPSIGFSSDYIDVAFTPRFSKVNYSIIENTIYHSSVYDNILQNIDKNSFYFFEPGITMRFGFKNIKIQFQHVEVKKLNSDQLDYVSAGNTVSILFTIPLKKKQLMGRRN